MQAFAAEPAEQRGMPRDGVRLLVATRDGLSAHAFRDLADHLRPGDLVVVNDSPTVPGEVDGVAARHRAADPVVVHVGDAARRRLAGRRAPHRARRRRAVLDATPGGPSTCAASRR